MGLKHQTNKQIIHKILNVYFYYKFGIELSNLGNFHYLSGMLRFGLESTNGERKSHQA